METKQDILSFLAKQAYSISNEFIKISYIHWHHH